jgi:hypothetical protein
MGDFWLSFLEMTDPLIQNIHACHSQNATEYISSSFDMLPWLVAYDNHNYGRWLTDYWAMVSSLSEEQMTFFSGHFSQSMTELPYSCQPLDMLIETTMNLHSKLKQGWLPVIQNEKQLLTTTRNTNNIARIKSLVHRNNHTIKLNQRLHAESQTARMKKDEQVIKDLIECMKDYEADPFHTSMPTLRSLQSGLLASSTLLHDFQTAFDVGIAQVAALPELQERVFTKSKHLSAPIISAGIRGLTLPVKKYVQQLAHL